MGSVKYDLTMVQFPYVRHCSMDREARASFFCEFPGCHTPPASINRSKLADACSRERYCVSTASLSRQVFSTALLRRRHRIDRRAPST